MFGLNRQEGGSYLGRVPAGHKHVFTTASFEHNYRSPIFANKPPVTKRLKLTGVLFFQCAIKLRFPRPSNFKTKLQWSYPNSAIAKTKTIS